MRKITALYINEMIKISKKVSVLVILIIMTVAVLFSGGMIKLSESLTSGIYTGYNFYGSDDFTLMQEEVDSLQSEVADLEEQLAAATDEAEKYYIREAIGNDNDRIELLELAIEARIPVYSSNDFRVQSLTDASNLKVLRRGLLAIDEADRTKNQNQMIEQYDNMISTFETLARQDDFRKYLDIRNAQIAADPTTSDDEKAIYTESNELWFNADPSGGLDGSNQTEQILSVLRQLETMKRSLLDNVDYVSASYSYAAAIPLTPSERLSMIDQAAVLTYRLDNQLQLYGGIESILGSGLSELAVQSMFGIGIFMIILLMMILAGGAVSQEIATGSIKSLIVSPAKRWKIFTAKVLSLLSVGLAATIYLYLLTMLTQGIMFGFDGAAPYVFASNGVAGELNFYLYKLCTLLINYIDVVVYLFLALMLSVITRNTAVSVGVSIGIYFVGGLFTQAMTIFAALSGSYDWQNFLPFANLDLAPRIFSFDALSMITGSGLAANGPTVQFSLIYLVVLVICIGYIALDSFNRRDIK